jgi:hypothetical protein
MGTLTPCASWRTMQIDVAPTDHRAVLDGRQQFLSVLNVLFLGDFLGEVQVVPADNGIFD